MNFLKIKIIKFFKSAFSSIFSRQNPKNRKLNKAYKIKQRILIDNGYDKWCMDSRQMMMIIYNIYYLSPTFNHLQQSL